jgi:hypothetical protein
MFCPQIRPFSQPSFPPSHARGIFLRRCPFHLATFVTQKKVPPVLNGLAAWQRRKEDAQGYRLVFVPFTQVLPQNRFGFDHQSV